MCMSWLLLILIVSMHGSKMKNYFVFMCLSHVTQCLNTHWLRTAVTVFAAYCSRSVLRVCITTVKPLSMG